VSPVTHLSPEIHADLRREVEALVGLKLSNLVELPSNGLTNKVFAAQSQSGAVVIRVSPPGGLQTYEKERECAVYAKTLGVRTPRIFGSGASATRAIQVSEYIPGTDLNRMEPTDRIGPWKQVGEMIQRLHHTTTANTGYSLERWAHAISQYCKTINHAGVPYHSEERLICIEGACSRLSKRTIRPVRCHANVSASNIRVDPHGCVWLLDWGGAIEHSPLMDIADLFVFDATEADRAAFFDGYGESFDLQNQMLKDFVITKLAAGYIWLERQAREPTRSQAATQYIAESHRVLERLTAYIACEN
jgi:Ser/Thr protein kinase RdoA (MazF antagonist)